MIMTIAGVTNTKINYNEFQEGSGRMRTLFDAIAEKSETRSKAEEIVETGYKFGLSENDTLERLQRKLDVLLQKAQEYFNMFKRQTI